MSSHTENRKQDHITLAMAADMARQGADQRFHYEPLLAAHPDASTSIAVSFLGKTVQTPIWVSSMTGGTEKAYVINQRLAAACARFGMGMGLGSCRPLLESPSRLRDFDLRDILGPDLPFYANLGIAQVENILDKNETEKITALIDLLRADGLIIHVNPLQEWLQPEGDRITRPPIETITAFLETFSKPVIVKEVGQGFGPESLHALLQLPVAAIEFAAYGGTNFAKLELLRAEKDAYDAYESVARIGHTAGEMVTWINQMTMEVKSGFDMQFILSGGIKDFLDGFYLTQSLKWPAVYGQASTLLQYAMDSQEALDQFLTRQIRGLQFARTYLRIR